MNEVPFKGTMLDSAGHLAYGCSLQHPAVLASAAEKPGVPASSLWLA